MARYVVNGPDHDFPGSTDWSAYGECPSCQQSAGAPCRKLSSLTQITSRGGSFMQRPHADRPVIR